MIWQDLAVSDPVMTHLLKSDKKSFCELESIGLQTFMEIMLNTTESCGHNYNTVINDKYILKVMIKWQI